MTINLRGLAEAKRKWFSARIFLATFAGVVLFLWLASGGSGQAAWELGLVSVGLPTVIVAMLAVISLASGNWQPDPHHWKDRAWVSGRAWVSITLALMPINIFLLLLK